MAIRAVTPRSEDDQKTNLPPTSPKIGHLSEELSPRAKEIQETVAKSNQIEIAGYSEKIHKLQSDCIVYLENEIRENTPAHRYTQVVSRFLPNYFDRSKGFKAIYPDLRKQAETLRKSLDEKEKMDELIESLENFLSWKPDFSQPIVDLRIDLIAHFWRCQNEEGISGYLWLIHPHERSSLLKVAKSFIKNKEFDLAMEVFDHILTDREYFSYGCYSASMLTLEFYLAGALQTSYLEVKQKLIFPKWEETSQITKEEAEEMNQLQEKCSGFLSAYKELARAREWCFLVECNFTKDPSSKEKAKQILKRLEEFNEMFSLKFFKTAFEECKKSLTIIATDFSETKPV